MLKIWWDCGNLQTPTPTQSFLGTFCNCLLYLHCVYDKPLFFSAASVWTRRENFCESVRVSVCVCDKPLAASRRTYTLAAMSTYHRNGFMRFIMVFWHSNWSLFSTYICVLCAMYIHNMFLLRFQFCERNNVSRHLCVWCAFHGYFDGSV